MDWRIGDSFRITGPSECWHPDRITHSGDWVPRAWSSYPGDPAGSHLLRAQELHVDFGSIFVIQELQTSSRFTSAGVDVDGWRIWINIQKNGVDWAVKTTSQ